MKERTETLQAKGQTVHILYRHFMEPLRGEVSGATIQDSPTAYTAFIDADANKQERAHTLGHELAHIFCGHFNRPGAAVDELEQEAESKAAEYYRAYKEKLKRGTLCR